MPGWGFCFAPTEAEVLLSRIPSRDRRLRDAEEEGGARASAREDGERRQSFDLRRRSFFANALNHLKPDGRGSIDRRHSVDRSERPQKFTSSKPSPAVPFPDDTLDDVSPVTALPHPRTESSKSRDGSREEREEGAPQRATQVRAQIDAATNEPVPLPDTAVPHDNAALDAFEAPPPPQQQQQQSTQLAVPQTANALAIFAASAAVAVLAFYIGFLRGTAAEQLNATAVH